MTNPSPNPDFPLPCTCRIEKAGHMMMHSAANRFRVTNEIIKQYVRLIIGLICAFVTVAAAQVENFPPINSDLVKNSFEKYGIYGTAIPIDIDSLEVPNIVPLPIKMFVFADAMPGQTFVGDGIVLPIVDSYIMQVSETQYESLLPTGESIAIHINRYSPWRVEHIDEKTLLLSSADGPSYKFRDGKLAELFYSENVALSIKRIGSARIDIVMNNQKVVASVRNTATGANLRIGGRTYLARAENQRPIFQGTATNLQIKRLESAFSSLTYNDQMVADASITMQSGGSPKLVLRTFNSLSVLPLHKLEETTPSEIGGVHEKWDNNYFAAGPAAGRIRRIRSDEAAITESKLVYDKTGKLHAILGFLTGSWINSKVFEVFDSSTHTARQYAGDGSGYFFSTDKK